MEQKKRLSRREFMRLSGVAAAGLIATACAPQAAPQQSSQPAAEPQQEEAAAEEAVEEPAEATSSDAPAEDTIQMVYHSWTTGPEHSGETQGILDFMEANPNTKVEDRQTPFAEYWKALLTDAGIGEPPDTYLMNNFFWQQYINADMGIDLIPSATLLDTPGTDVAAYIPSVLEAAKREGSLYGFPKAVNGSAFIINKTLFEEAGVDLPPASPEDWTYDDFENTARAMTNPDNKVFGAWIQEGPHWTPTFLFTLGGRYLDPETASTAEGYLNSEANAEWVQWVKNMTDEGLMPLPGGLDALGGDAGAMAGGNLAMTHTDGFQQVAFAKNEGVEYEWQGAKTPKPTSDSELKTHLAIHGTMVPKGVRDVALSTQLAGFTAYGSGSILENPAKLSPFTEFAEQQANGDSPHFKPLLDQCFAPQVELHEGARIVHMDILTEEWADMMDRVMIDDMSPIESLNTAAANYDKRVAEKEG